MRQTQSRAGSRGGWAGALCDIRWVSHPRVLSRSLGSTTMHDDSVESPPPSFTVCEARNGLGAANELRQHLAYGPGSCVGLQALPGHILSLSTPNEHLKHAPEVPGRLPARKDGNLETQGYGRRGRSMCSMRSTPQPHLTRPSLVVRRYI